MNNMERRAKANYNHSHLGQRESWVHVMWHISPSISFGTVLELSVYLSIHIGPWDKEDFTLQNPHKGISNDPQEVEDTKRTATINRELTRLLQGGSGTRGAPATQCWLCHQKHPPLLRYLVSSVQHTEDGTLPKDALYRQLTTGTRGVRCLHLWFKEVCKRDLASV